MKVVAAIRSASKSRAQRPVLANEMQHVDRKIALFLMNQKLESVFQQRSQERGQLSRQTEGIGGGEFVAYFGNDVVVFCSRPIGRADDLRRKER